ncbi:MAG: hypothetical protein ACHQFX_11235 [Chitinophagales bacterium]
MSLRRPFLILVLLFVCSLSFSQQGFLFVKKGFHKKRTYTEGDVLHIKLADGSYRKGVITLLRNDTIFINGEPVWRPLVTKVLLERKPKMPWPDKQTLLLIGAGVALTTAGLTLSKQADIEEALVAGLVIGYGPILIKHAGGGLIRSFKRKKFRIGKKFRLQVLDFHLPQNKLKSF